MVHFLSVITSIVSKLGEWYAPVNSVYKWVLAFLSLFNLHYLAFFIIGFFFTRKFPEAKKHHR